MNMWEKKTEKKKNNCMFYLISKPLLVKKECFVELQKNIWEN
jgi:hypothetical protein